LPIPTSNPVHKGIHIYREAEIDDQLITIT
jgi:hypothetical protein